MAGALAIGVVWIGSVWINAGLHTRWLHELVVADGQARVNWCTWRDERDKGRLQSWSGLSGEPRMEWGFSVRKTDQISWGHYAGQEYLEVVVPLWVPFAVLAGFTLVAWRWEWLDRRARRREACERCGYSKVGLAKGARCPECGDGDAQSRSTDSMNQRAVQQSSDDR